MRGHRRENALFAFSICDDGDPDKARGVIHIKDLYAFRDRFKIAGDLLPVARKLMCVPESARLERLLHRFLEKKSHLSPLRSPIGCRSESSTSGPSSDSTPTFADRAG